MSSEREATFTIKVVGETTGEEFAGEFRVKTMLSHNEQLRAEALRRELLGQNPEQATPRARNQAEILSYLMAHIVKSPSFWKESNGGLELYDDSVLRAVHDGAQGAEAKALEAVRAKAEAAKTELRS